MSNKVDGVKVIVAGEYVWRDGRQAKLELYEEGFEIAGVLSEGDALCVVQNGLLGDRLRGTKDGYKRWRTCGVVGFKAGKVSTDGADELLVECSKLGIVPENLGLYSSKEARRSALKRALDGYNARMAAAKKRGVDREESAYVD